jgi:hypothetical protein
VRKAWYPPTYDLYFTDRRVIFAKVGDFVPSGVGVGFILSEIGEAAEKRGIKEKRGKYAQMTPQEIADGKDNVGVFYSDIASVLVKGKRVPEIWFTFSRKQKLDWEKVGFVVYGGNLFDETVRSAGELLRKSLAAKLDVQLESPKLIELFGNTNPPPPPSS